MSTNKIKVNVNPVADAYTAPNERIIEYSSACGGGLISFRIMDDGTLSVELYREDDTVNIRIAKRHYEES